MPNVILQIRQETARVRKMLPHLERSRREVALVAIQFAETALALNSYAEMREALDVLEELALPPVIEDPPAK